MDEIKYHINNEDKLSTVYKNAIDSMWLINVEGVNKFRFVDINDAFIAVTGLTREKVIGKMMEEVLPPSSHDFVRTKYNEAIKAERITNYVEVADLPNGERIGEIRLIPIKNKKGAFTQLLGIANDITEKKKIERELVESEQKYRWIFDHMLNAFAHYKIILDKNNNPIDYAYISVNPACERIVGVKWDDLKDTTIKQLRPNIDPEWIRLCGEVAINGGIKTQEHYSKTLKKTFLGTLYSPRLLEFIIIFEDISERKETEGKNIFKANLLNTIGQAVIATDLHGTVNYGNKAAEDMYGWRMDEAIAKNIIDLTPTRQSKEQALQIMEKLKTGQSWAVEFWVQRKNGTDFSIFIDANGETRVSSLVVDLTERKKLQDRLLAEKILHQKQNTQILVLAQERERNYIGTGLHDNVNQLLANAKMMIETAGACPTLRVQCIAKSHTSIVMAIEETRKLSHSMVTPVFNATQSFIRAVNELVSDIKLSGKLDIVLNIPATSNFTVSNGQAKLTLYRIIQEQLNNILKHAKASVASIRLTNEEDMYKLIIEDDGIGFDVSKNFKGIGLKNIASRAELLSGKLEIVSFPGKGSCLKVGIPVDKVRHYAY